MSNFGACDPAAPGGRLLLPADCRRDVSGDRRWWEREPAVYHPIGCNGGFSLWTDYIAVWWRIKPSYSASKAPPVIVGATRRQSKFTGVAERFRIGYEFIEALKELRVNHDFV